MGAGMGLAIHNERSEYNAIESVIYPPQPWNYNESIAAINEIDPKQIISYDIEGRVYSHYEDDVWYLTYSLNPKLHDQIDFDKIKSAEDRVLIKRVMFAVIHFSKGKGNSIKAPSSIQPFYGKVLLPMHEYASRLNFSLASLFEHKQRIRHYLSTIVKMNNNRAQTHTTLFRFLQKMPKNISGVRYNAEPRHEKLLSQYTKEYKNKLNQSECIPPRILQNAQKMRWEHIYAVDEVLPKLIQFISRLMDEPFNYYSFKGHTKRKAKKAGMPPPKSFMTPQQLIEELELVAFCKRYEIEGRESLKHYLSRLSSTSRHLIYGYTGMRNDEGCLLEVGCYQDKGAGVHPVINGLEKKNGIPETHPFVTVTEIKKVIEVQENITRTIAKYTHPDEMFLPLLFNSTWIVRSTKHLEADTKYPNRELPLDESQLIITKEEMDNTLKATEPERDWDNDKNYQVDKVWKFKWHQYRRTIAVYALNTGLVSLTALGKQFRHFFEATTAHYGNGHFVAEPLAGTDSKYHVKYEMDNQREEYEAIVMYRDMMFNLERPESGFAPQGNNEEDIMPEDQILNPQTHGTVAKRLKSGESSYTNTAIGHCKSLKPCDGHMMLFFAGCVGCIDAEVNDDKLENTIQSTNKLKLDLELHMPGSVELRDIETDLVALARFQQKRQGTNHE